MLVGSVQQIEPIATHDPLDQKDDSSGVVLHVRDDGDCDNVSVEGFAEIPADDLAVLEVKYSTDEQCKVTLDSVTKTDQTNIDLRTERSEGVGTVYGNYLHTFQTVQDIVNIDIAKLQFDTNRNWDGSCSWWADTPPPAFYAAASTGVKWNHPYKPTIQDQVQRACGADWARAYGFAGFHSDFLWCNFKSEWQTIELAQWNYTRADGTGGVNWWQNRSCPGTHMATKIWQNTNPH